MSLLYLMGLVAMAHADTITSCPFHFLSQYCYILHFRNIYLVLLLPAFRLTEKNVYLFAVPINSRNTRLPKGSSSQWMNKMPISIAYSAIWAVYAGFTIVNVAQIAPLGWRNLYTF